MGKKDLISVTFDKENSYPLFYHGDDENHYLYFSRIEKVNNKKVLVYTDNFCMCDIRNLDMKLNSYILKRGFI